MVINSSLSLRLAKWGMIIDPNNISPSEFDIDIYHVESMKELAEQFVDDGLFGDIPSHLSNYIDMDAIVRDLTFDYTETEIAGQFCIYRAG